LGERAFWTAPRTCSSHLFQMFPSRKLTILLAFSPLAFSADYQIEANIRYGQYPETVLDIIQSPAPALKNRPGVIVIHGGDQHSGGWTDGDKASAVEKFCVPLVQHDFVVANVEYRLAKAAPAPAAVNDVLEAALWFRNHAARFKVDASQILVLGESAGGYLALMVGMTPASADLGPVIKIAAVINFYGMSDIADQLEGPHQQAYAAEWIPEQPGRMELAHRLSPITYVRKGLPPILTIHGDVDPVVPYDQSVRLAKALKEGGDDAELITVSGGKHGLEADQMSKLWPQIFKWVKKRKIGS
jgi:acetyl esterase/lipase